MTIVILVAFLTLIGTWIASRNDEKFKHLRRFLILVIVFCSITAGLKNQKIQNRIAKLEDIISSPQFHSDTFHIDKKSLLDAENIINESKNYYHLGVAYLIVGKYDKSLNYLNLSIQNMPNFQAYLSKGSCLISLDKYQEAIESFKLAEKFDDSCSCLYEKIALANRFLSDYQEALYYSNLAVSKNPYSHLLHSFKGGDLIMLNKHKEAIESLNKSISIKPSEFSHTMKGICLLKLDKKEEALSEINTALTLNSNYRLAANSKIQILVDMSKYDEALKIIDEILISHPDDYQQYINKAYYFYKKENLYDALAYVDKALVLKPDNKEAIKFKEKLTHIYNHH